MPGEHLLAVDVGLRTGLAAYGRDARLLWYRSHHLADRAALGRAVHGLLRGLPELEAVALEGGGPLAEAWSRGARRLGLAVLPVAAETWRAALLPAAACARGSGRSKAAAALLARRVIDWSGASRPTSLRHDTAEAILVGLWATRQLGWLSHLPRELERGR